MNLDNIQTGDVLLTRTRWKWYKLNTYLSRLINFGTNFWTGIQGKPYSPCNHSAIFVWIDKVLYVFESDSKGFTRKPAIEYLQGIADDNYWIKRYPNIHATTCYSNTVKIEGFGYNYLKLFKEVPNQLTNENFETVRKKPMKKMVCSQAVAFVINSTDARYCINPNNYDPQDLFFDNDSKFITFK